MKNNYETVLILILSFALGFLIAACLAHGGAYILREAAREFIRFFLYMAGAAVAGGFLGWFIVNWIFK